MAQASSAQREPSMEEILASIRRIIEDSDTVKKPSAFDRHAPSHFDGDEGDDPAFEPANSDVVSFLRPADLAERESADRDQAVATTPAPSDEPEVPEVQADPSPIAAGPEVFGETETFELPDDFAAEFEELQAALEQDAHARDDAAHEAPPPLEPIAEAGRAPILSENAGRQVAASFGELTDAFAASRRKSFDEMAEDMLRPMLQEWLDDNLPTLVERLVREEIERVARGGSR
jgi:cell pole-organizing protein PopZ